MSAEIVEFPGGTVGHIEPDTILENNKGALKELVLVGMDKEGNFVIASSEGYAPDIMMLLQMGLHQVVSKSFE